MKILVWKTKRMWKTQTVDKLRNTVLQEPAKGSHVHKVRSFLYRTLRLVLRNFSWSDTLHESVENSEFFSSFDSFCKSKVIRIFEVCTNGYTVC